MQINLTSFEKEMTTEDRIEDTISSGITFKGLENVSNLQEILNDILLNYELEEGVLKLIKEYCQNCEKKLKRKGKYTKDITLPGGATILLTFHQYSCKHCKKKVDRRLGSWFTKGERYSSNIKSDATRLYLSHLSSYDNVREELNKIYGVSLSKRTIRRWLNASGILAYTTLNDEKNFSGHFIYDEEYMKVFLGDVGKKDSKLQRTEVYLLLFIDALTGKPILMLSDSLDKSVLIEHWRRFAKWTQENNIPFSTLTTDGKREYNTLVKELNCSLRMNVKHSYCVFHFKKNLYEVSNKHIFGVMKTKKELPEHVISQIKELESLVDQPTRKEFFKTLQTTLFQKQTFIPPLQDQIKRLKKYAENYALHKEYPFLRTTNMAEHWFGRTKPEKVKKGFKTKEGLIRVLRSLAVKITDVNWKQRLNLTRDINDATNLLISGLLKKRPA
jgi:transposase-like protein